MPSDPPLIPRPGERLALILAKIPAWEHPIVLERMERKYLAEGTLDLLREVKAYRRLLEEQAKPPRSK